MNIIRIALAIIFGTLGFLSIGMVPLSIFGPESFATRMNKVFFQPRADAEANRLIEKGIFTQEQHDEIRGFVRRVYISDLVTVNIAMIAGAITFGISLISLAYSLRLSVKLSVLSRRLKAEETKAVDRLPDAER